MASNVNVLCPNGHRVTVKVTPTMSVLHIIEEVCKKKGFQADTFDIKSEAGKVPIDVTLQLRYANLPNNAKLELIPAAVPRSVGGGAGSGANVSISLQMPDGARLKPLDFAVDVTLWEVLRGFEKEEPSAVVSLLDSQEMEPVIVYMRDQICGETRLKSTSLKSLGLISGRGLLRLNQRQKTQDSSPTSVAAASSDAAMDVDAASVTATTSTVAAAAATNDPLAGMKLSDEQMKMIESISEGYREYQRDSGQNSTAPSASNAVAAAAPTDAASSFPLFPAPTRDFLPDMPRGPPPPPTQATASSSKAASPPVAVVRPQMEFANFKFPESGSGASGGACAKEEGSSLPDNSTEPCDREIQVFDLESFGQSASSTSMEVDDDFFELTIDDLRSRMSDLQRLANEDAPLLTSAMRQKREEAKFANYHRTLIRIHFPDKTVLQGMFRLRETVGALYDFVSSNLAQRTSAFSLYVTPPRQDLKEKQLTLMAAGLVPAAKVYFGAKNASTTAMTEKYLSDECMKHLVRQPDVQRDLTRTGSSSQTDAGAGPSKTEPKTAPAKRQTNDAAKSAEGAAGGKMPKWFAAGKKK